MAAPPAKRPCHRRSWSDLPHDILGDVLRRLPGYGDHVRFRGACRTWRAAERAHPRPPMPWLVSPGHCVSLHDAAIYRVGPLPEKAAAACRGSFGDWLALVPPSTECHPFLLNAFTMAKILLPRWEVDDSTITKIVLSAAPDSVRCTVAAIADRLDDRGGREIIVCRYPGQSENHRWWSITKACRFHDIVFFEGNIHVLDMGGRVHVFADYELEQLRHGTWKPAAAHKKKKEEASTSKFYLVAFPERLVAVSRSFETRNASLPGTSRVNFTCRAKVFALDDGKQTVNRLAPIKDLDGHAIFLGYACSAAFLVTSAAAGNSGIKANQICFVDEERSALHDASRPAEIAAARPGTALHGHRPFMLQSYDMSTSCLRTYHKFSLEPTPAMSSTTRWRCIAAHRFPRGMDIPPTPETHLGHQLLLWEVMGCLGADEIPSYEYDSTAAATTTAAVGQCDGHNGQRCRGAVTVRVLIPKSSGLDRHYHDWRFTRCGRSVSEAKQAAVYEAVTFLRSWFAGVLDDSPWSSVPRYHKPIDEDEALTTHVHDDNDNDESSSDEEEIPWLR